MARYESSEDYLERILMLQKKIGRVRSIDIVEAMNFSRASVSVAMKKLKENNYIEIDNDGYITLTSKGRNVASSVFERHELISDFLQFIGVDKKIALEDACKIEHDLSQDSFLALKEFYNKNK